MDNFSFLDQQLAQLLVRICIEQGCTPDKAQRAMLNQVVQQLCAATREGIIALPLDTLEPAPDCNTLTSLPVTGPPGAYTPLIVEDGHIWLHRYWQYEQRLATNLQHRLAQQALSTAQNHHTYHTLRSTLSNWRTAGAVKSKAAADPPQTPPPETESNSEGKIETDWQLRAVALASIHRFSIISGGPGTGKTTTVTRLLWLLTAQLQLKPQRILLAAPTGKAAMRLQESIRQTKAALHIPAPQAANIPDEASTLHRLLGYIPGKVSFRHHRHNVLPADVVIVDEASMIDISLMTHLFEAVADEARLILLGDKDQLASVETGSVFRDLCASAANQHSPQQQQLLSELCGDEPPPARNTDPAKAEVAPVSAGNSLTTHLTAPSAHQLTNQLTDHIVVLAKSWRFGAGSGIAQLAAAVCDGDKARLHNILQQDWPDIIWTQADQLSVAELLAPWQDYFQLLAKPPTGQDNYDQWLQRMFAAFNHFRILSSLRNGPSGTEQLNQQLDQTIRRQQATNNLWYPGRPVMVTRNDYRQQLFNGDIGLTLHDAQREGLRVWFPQDDGFRAVSPLRLPQHETAWAMTIHKSQGSEFNQVLLLLPEDEDVRVLGRELLYTGITRAKATIHLQGKLAVLHAAMAQVAPPSSRIRQRLT